MKYGSVCSGIEAASVAWHHLGWKAQWFSEIEHFPSEVLKYRYPTVENLGDMTKLTINETFKASTIDLLVGGTPCQSFSVAGLRGGLADPRGNLMLTFLSLADSKKPRWIVWENVPGVLSSNGGKDFGTFLGALGELGYGFAYRVLDAQHFGVAQRRRRVFVVGYLGDWRVAGAVLFERESLQRDIKPSRKKRQEVTSDVERSLGEAGDAEPIAYSFDALSSNSMKSSNPHSGCREVDVAKTLDTTTPEPSKNQGGIAIAQPISIDHQCNASTNQFGTLIKGGEGGTQQFVAQPIAIAENTIGRQPMNGGNGDGFTEDGPMYTLNATGVHGVAQPFRKVRRAQSDSDFETWEKDETANTLNCFDVGDVRSTNVVAQPIAVDVYNQSIDGQTSATITEAVGGTNTSGPKVMQAAGFLPTQGSAAKGIGYEIEQAPTLRAGCDNYGLHHPPMAIRRLTPKECERLQGFPDDWTKIPYRNKPADQCPDGPRYKACGNSMAVPVMRWIGERIQLIDTIIN
jgi:DNA (cytosine-5)-methyltransferase 1